MGYTDFRRHQRSISSVNGNLKYIDRMLKEVKSDLKIENKNVNFLDARHFIQEEQPKEISWLFFDFLNS